MSKTKPKTAGLTPAATYVRMSSGKQERSPAQQRAELKRLAEREGCRIVAEFSDEAITGDSGPTQRPGFQAMLAAAERGEFKTLLAYDQDRIGRFDSLDAGRWLSVLRDARVQVTTCVQGRIDLESFAGRLVFTVNQEAKKMFLVEHSAKVLRGKRENAEHGNWNGGPIPYAFERAEYDAAGNLVRRLEPKQPKSTEKGHRVRLVPVEDANQLAAVRFAFKRFAGADVSVRGLARELAGKGFPSPNGSGWTHCAVGKMLANPIYCGGTRWNAVSWGKYHSIQGGEITATNRRGGPRRQNDEADVIVRPGTHEGIVSRKLFQKVQKRLAAKDKRRHARRTEYPLTGLMFCEHCGRPMQGETVRGRSQYGKGYYAYQKYVCASYRGDKHRNASGCGHFTVPADRVARWLVGALQAEFLGPGRDELVAEIRRQLKAEAKGSKGDTHRLQDRLADLDIQVARLVKAIRSTDAPELVDELRAVRADREAVQNELQRAGRYAEPQDLDREAEATAGELVGLVERLADADPATLREVFGLLVSRITCRWERTTCKTGRQRCSLVEGVVELRDLGLQSCLLGGVAYVGASVTRPKKRVLRFTLADLQAVA